MPTWKLHKGESKTFEGTVLIATISGGALTNYDITNATLGFDMGSTMGQWMIRTDSLYGSLGTNLFVNGDFSNGTTNWATSNATQITGFATFVSDFNWPKTITATVVMPGLQYGSLTYTSTLSLPAGTYKWSIDSKAILLSPAIFLMGTFELNSLYSTIVNGTNAVQWQTYEGTVVNQRNYESNPVFAFQTPSSGRTAIIDNLTLKRQVATSGIQVIVGSMGVYRYTWEPADTENLVATSYYFDIWLRTAAGKEYTLTVGTVQLLPVVGTM